MTTCELIDKILKEKKWSRRKLAIKAEIPPSSLQSAMQRNTTLSVDMLVRIAKALGLDSPAALLDPTEDTDGFIDVLFTDIADSLGDTDFFTKHNKKPANNNVDELCLTDNELKLILWLRSLPPEMREAVLNIPTGSGTSDNHQE